MDKKAIRAAILEKRDSLSAGQRQAKDEEIKKRLLALEEFKRAKTVLLYASFRSEVGTAGIIREALEAGKRVLLPKVESDELELYEIKGARGLSRGYMGIPEPEAAGKPEDILSAGAVIVPGVAFDTLGGRLGYGKGFYDRLLSRRGERSKDIPLVGLAYEVQIYGEKLPVTAGDVPMDKIVTEERIIVAGEGRR